VVAPIATLGILVGHELAYAITGTAREDLHGYLDHLPQIALILTLLSLAGASFVDRSARMAVWPFPAVTVIGFVLQEHLEQLQHSGSVPLLLDRPAFLVGVGVQGLVALVAWLVARLLVRTLAAENVCHPLVAHWSLTCVPSEPVPVAVRTVQSRRSRAPPSSR
jgi:hypothetical protein